MSLSDDSVFRVAIESAPSGIVVCDEEGAILFVNRQIEAIFGYAADEISGHAIDELVPAAGRAAHQTARGDFRAKPESRAGPRRVMTGRRNDGSEVPVEVGLTVVDGDRGRLVVACVVDITDRLTLQNRLVQTAREHTTFERLVSELSARFANLAGEQQINEAIVDSLHQLCETLDLDRSTLWFLSPDASDGAATYTWTRSEYRVVQSGQTLAAVLPWTFSQLQKGETVSFSNVNDLPNPVDRDTQRRFNTKSGVALPFAVNGEVRAILGLGASRAERAWPPEVVEHLRLVAAVFGHALARKDSGDRLQKALAEVQQLRDQLAIENVQLRGAVKVLGVSNLVVAESAAARRVLAQIESVAPTDATVLLLGETGSGKEVFAQLIHRSSERHRRPMITVNCAAIPSALVESELFGRERGAYTGALARQIGRFELGQDSTIFLDEVGDLPLEVQVKLLRVLQEKVIERLGSGQSIKVNVRIIAATNRDLEKAVADRTFREDLFYRLNVFPITIPPLRERVADIPALVWTFIEEYATAFRKPIDSISKDCLAALQRYHWPGNVRELRNVIERAVIVAKGSRLVVDLPNAAAVAPQSSTRLNDFEAVQIRRILESVRWRVRGAGGAAELLGMNPNTLDSRMAKLGIRRPRGSSPNTPTHETTVPRD